MKITQRLETDPHRVVSCLTEWNVTVAWSPEQLGISICIRGEDEDGNAVLYIWLYPETMETDTYSVHLTVNPKYHRRWFSRSLIAEFRTVLAFLNVSHLVIEHFNPTTRRMASVLGATPVSKTLSFLKLK